MTQLLEVREAEFGAADSPIGFITQGGGHWEVWDRYLTLDGKPAFHIGNICNTCNYFFERLDGANRSLSQDEAITALTNGIKSVADPAVETLARVLPRSDYAATLLFARPQLTVPGSATDYFAHELIDLWGLDKFWGLPHHPRTEYYRAGDTPIGDAGRIYEFVVPMFPHGWLAPERVAQYASACQQDSLPTAFAISVLDVKQSAQWDEESPVTEHWCLAHYLLDGHHKLFAAAQGGHPLTLLSYLAVNHGISTSEQVSRLLIALRGNAAP